MAVAVAALLVTTALHSSHARDIRHKGLGSTAGPGAVQHMAVGASANGETTLVRQGVHAADTYGMYA